LIEDIIINEVMTKDRPIKPTRTQNKPDHLYWS